VCVGCGVAIGIVLVKTKLLQQAESALKKVLGSGSGSSGKFDVNKAVRPNILKLQPYRCARDDYDTGSRAGYLFVTLD
jgi:hypothetical protein